jgi:hypothetical protein
MRKTTINTNGTLTICWFNNAIVDIVCGGKIYYLDGKIEEKLKYHFGATFDSSIISDNGVYAFIYKKTGTKGLLLKNGEIVREINRSYYLAEDYEYPAVFLTLNNGETYLIHCPEKYCRIDFENVETGEIVTNIPDREPSDFFHSRFEISSNNKFLLSKGWVWHPLSIITVFDIEECFKNPLLLDNPENSPNVGTEINTACFVSENEILIGSSEEEPYNDELAEVLPQNSIAIWNVETKEISKPTRLNFEFGNLFAVDKNYTWDLYKYPKLINIASGEIIYEDKETFSGEQNSSIIGYLENQPKIAYDRKTKNIAITNGEKIEIYSK